MLSCDPLVAPKPPLLSSEDLENFYQIIADGSYQVNEPCAGTLTIFKKNYFEYLQHILKKSTNESKAIEIKKRILLDQLKLLKEKKFFENKLDEKIVNAIQSDLLNGGTHLKSIITEDNSDEIIIQLGNINNISLTSNSSAQKMYPDKLQSGLSTSEKRSLTYGLDYQATSLNNNLNKDGLKHFHKKEWDPAIKYFEEAITATQEMSSTLHKELDSDTIATYYRNISAAHHNWGDQLQQDSNLTSAIEHYQAAINAREKIPARLLTRLDQNNLKDSQQCFIFAVNSLGIQFYKTQQFELAREQFSTALVAYKKLNLQYDATEHNNNFSVFSRNLAYSYDHLGNIALQQNNFNASIAHHNAALYNFLQITTPTASDKKYIATSYRNLAFVLNYKGLSYLNQNNYSDAQNNFEAALTVLKKMPRVFFLNTDLESRQIYQNNYNCALAKIEAIKSLTQNPMRFFNKDTNQNQPEYIPHRDKRRRIG